MATVGIYLKYLREDQGLTQEQAGDAIGMSDRIVSAWEKGRHQPKVEQLYALVEYLGGVWDDITILMRKGSRKDEALELAKRRRSGDRGFSGEERAYLESLSPEQKAALLAVARQMKRE